jgi:hypothetical protein
VNAGRSSKKTPARRFALTPPRPSHPPFRNADRDGKISPAELDAFLVDDLGLDPATARNLAQVADVDRDGKLCLDEFTRCISDFIANPRMDID